LRRPSATWNWKKGVAGHESHGGEVCHVPSTDDDATAVRLFTNESDGFGHLIVFNTIWTDPAAPLLAVDRSKVAMFVGPLVPNADAILLQVTHVGVPLEEPQQFVDHGRDVDALGGHQREPLAEVKTAFGGRRR